MDIGGKLAWFLVAILISMFAAAAMSEAQKGISKSDDNTKTIGETRERIVRLETQFSSINYRLDEIKALIEKKGNGR